MPHDPQKYLYDILSSCEFLIEFTADRAVDDYARDRGFRSAVERELQIIGEAVLQLDRVAPQVAARIPEYRNIIGFRHVLVHGYDSLQPATVWNVIEVKLAALAREVRGLLDELEAESGAEQD
ncbi:MAG: DUF86 domain-containing protein [Phycisphaerae bacterium]